MVWNNNLSIDQSLQNEVKEMFFVLAEAYTQRKFPWMLTYPGMYATVGIFMRDLLLPFFVARWHATWWGKPFLDFIRLDTTWEENTCLSQIMHEYVQNCLQTTRFVSANFVDATWSEIGNVELVGDIHPHLHTKSLITTSEDKSIVYKKDYASDFQLRELFLALYPDCVYMLPMHDVYDKIIVRKYIPIREESNDNQEIEAYYFQLWAMLALFGMFRWIDLNYDNVICSLPFPIFFDYECLFLPELAKNKDLYDMFYTWFLDEDTENNISLLRWGYTPSMSYMDPILNLQDGVPYLKWTTTSNQIAHHIPHLHWSKVQSKNYISHFLSGFTSLAHRLQQKTDIIYDFLATHTLYTRILLRPTRLYVTLQREIAMKVALGNDRANIQHMLNDVLSNSMIVARMNKERNYISLESSNLLEWLIPSRYGNIEDTYVLAANGQLVGTLPHSPKETWKAHMQNIHNRYTAQQQIITKLFA